MGEDYTRSDRISLLARLFLPLPSLVTTKVESEEVKRLLARQGIERYGYGVFGSTFQQFIPFRTGSLGLERRYLIEWDYS